MTLTPDKPSGGSPPVESPRLAPRAPEFLNGLRLILGSDGLLTDAAARSVYACDASHLRLGRPLAVALPRTQAHAARVITLCASHGVPVVARGAGTGLSGGAVPPDGALVLSLARLDTIGAVDVTGRCVTAGAGVLNERVTRAALPHGLQFAPDPSSQSASTIGGNIAENAGGPHTLKVGVTLHHLQRLEWIDATGHERTTGRGLAVERGIDLLGLLCGSEGTLGVVTAADLRLIPTPPARATLLAHFPLLDDATAAVVALMGVGLLPEAVEMVDRAMLEAVEQAFHFGFPTDVDASLIVEFGGRQEAVDEDAGRAAAVLRERGAREVRRASDDQERNALWRCRKKAFGAVGRLAPNYVSMDVCVPLGRLPDIVREVRRVAQEQRVRIGTALHAGDGNLHPGVHYDARDPDETARAKAAADAIILAALAMGGSVTGEHGVGLEKLHVVGLQCDDVASSLMHGIAGVFDRACILNPGKALPSEPKPESRGLTEAAHLLLGAVHGLRAGDRPPVPERTAFNWDSLTVTAPSAVELAEIQAAALARGLWVPLGVVRPGRDGPGLGAGGSVGDLIQRGLPGPSFLGRGTVRDSLLEVWAETGDGRFFHAGAPVFKNVAGYDLVRLVCGSGGVLARAQAATFQLKPIPEKAVLWDLVSAGNGHGASRLAQVGGAPDFASLIAILTSWEADLASPTFVAEAAESGAWRLVVLAAGRDRAWDLDHCRREIAEWAATVDLTLTDEERVPFANVAELAAHPAIPAWARAEPDWTMLARSRGASAWPSELPDRRAIWQASPLLVWLPGSVAAADAAKESQAQPFAAGGSSRWCSDALFRGGIATVPPAPRDPGVPLDLLAALKRVFDPHGRLPSLPWLGDAA